MSTLSCSINAAIGVSVGVSVGVAIPARRDGARGRLLHALHPGARRDALHHIHRCQLWVLLSVLLSGYEVLLLVVLSGERGTFAVPAVPHPG